MIEAQSALKSVLILNQPPPTPADHMTTAETSLWSLDSVTSSLPPDSMTLISN